MWWHHVCLLFCLLILFYVLLWDLFYARVVVLSWLCFAFFTGIYRTWRQAVDKSTWASDKTAHGFTLSISWGIDVVLLSWNHGIAALSFIRVSTFSFLDYLVKECVSYFVRTKTSQACSSSTQRETLILSPQREQNTLQFLFMKSLKQDNLAKIRQGQERSKQTDQVIDMR